MQEALVAAFAAAAAADPALGADVAELAAQADEQLDPAAGGRPRRRGPGIVVGRVTAGRGPALWLRGQVAAAATSHATASVDQSGARAALLGRSPRVCAARTEDWRDGDG